MGDVKVNVAAEKINENGEMEITDSKTMTYNSKVHGKEVKSKETKKTDVIDI